MTRYLYTAVPVVTRKAHGFCFSSTAGMMKQAHQEAQPEFQIQPDEFPALPGANKQSGTRPTVSLMCHQRHE